MKKYSLKNYGYLWLTLFFFVFSICGHWIFGWLTYVEEQTAHHQPVETSSYLFAMLRDTFENWQSEFLQLLWQVGGLAVFLCVGSPQSKESEDRAEAKLDAILQAVDKNSAETLHRINSLYFKDS